MIHKGVAVASANASIHPVDASDAVVMGDSPRTPKAGEPLFSVSLQLNSTSPAAALIFNQAFRNECFSCFMREGGPVSAYT